MDIYQFVNNSFGEAAEANLKNIRKGGDNNQKGSRYEDLFAVAKLFDMAAQEVTSGRSTPTQFYDVQITSQEIAFVDDLCIRNKTIPSKWNYQAKNSSTNNADWTEDTTDRFSKQARIDQDFHDFQTSTQVLLVSCPQKAENNNGKIPAQHTESMKSEYFPYCATPSLILTHSKTKECIAAVCRSDSASTAQTAFSSVMGVWVLAADGVTLSDVFERAMSNAKPNVFAGLSPQVGPLPQWLTDICATFAGAEIRVISDRCVVLYNGMEVSVGVKVLEIEPTEEVTSMGQLVQLLMTRASQELVD